MIDRFRGFLVFRLGGLIRLMTYMLVLLRFVSDFLWFFLLLLSFSYFSSVLVCLFVLSLSPPFLSVILPFFGGSFGVLRVLQSLSSIIR